MKAALVYAAVLIWFGLEIVEQLEPILTRLSQ